MDMEFEDLDAMAESEFSSTSEDEDEQLGDAYEAYAKWGFLGDVERKGTPSVSCILSVALYVIMTYMYNIQSAHPLIHSYSVLVLSF